MRALTHAAFSLGLEQTCRNLHLPAIGFVILDSPLVTFREAEADEAGLDAGTRLEVKRAFYRDLAARVRTDQVIVVENEDPEVELRPTKNQIDDLLGEIRKREQVGERSVISHARINAPSTAIGKYIFDSPRLE